MGTDDFGSQSSECSLESSVDRESTDFETGVERPSAVRTKSSVTETDTTADDTPNNFLDTLVKEIPYEYRLRKYRVRRVPVQQVAYEMDDIYRFRNTVAVGKSSGNTIMSLTATRSTTMRNFLKKRQRDAEREELYKKLAPAPREDDVRFPIEVVVWEDQAWREFDEEVSPREKAERTKREGVHPFPSGAFSSADGHSPEDGFSSEESTSYDPARNDPGRVSPLTPLATSLNKVTTQEFVNDRLLSLWEEDVFCDAVPRLQARLALYVDDPNIIFERVDEKRKGKGKKKAVVERAGRNRYNIGNDKYYNSEMKKVSLGTFGVQHSLLALRLDNRFYRANYTRDELKNFHRPPLSLSNREYPLSPLETRPAPKAPGAPQTVIKRPADLSLAQPVPFVVLEYAEEHPFFVVNPGMASLLNRYYRRSDADDESRVTDCVILEPDEEAPFFGFGDVLPGTYQHALTNNLFTAPVFPHRSTDFLCISTGDRLILRPLGTVHLVGQEFPKEEIFAPHSRRLNQFSKDFLRTVTHRVFSKGKDLLMSDLDAMLPYFSEGSKRKWLKEYADCVKKGRDNVWVAKETASRLGEESLRRLVTPENVCQYESMLATEVRMQDQGYRFVDSEEDECGKHSPSWALTRNFLNAAGGRGLLELTHDGSIQAVPDTTDTGMIDELFFSFKRVKLKKGSEAENRRILNEHQASYRARITRIWRQQTEAFSSPDLPEVAAEAVSRTKSKDPDLATTPEISSQPLTIRRTFLENGITVTRVEHISDPRVVRAYLKARKKHLPEKKGVLRCSNCGQTGHMKTNKTCPNYMGVAKGRTDADRRRAKTYMQDIMNRLLTKFTAIPFSNAFHRPVSAKKFPDYPRIVKTPIDFSTIRTKIRTFAYRTYADFRADFKLMLDNCVLYNGPTHSLTDIATGIYNDVCAYEADNAEQIANAENLIMADDTT